MTKPSQRKSRKPRAPKAAASNEISQQPTTPESGDHRNDLGNDLGNNLGNDLAQQFLDFWQRNLVAWSQDTRLGANPSAVVDLAKSWVSHDFHKDPTAASEPPKRDEGG